MKKLLSSLSASWKALWKTLDRSIYTGERLKSNMLALSFASYVSAALGLVLIFLNIPVVHVDMLLASITTLVAGLGCAYCVNVLKNRELAIKIPTLFGMIMFTFYALTGAGEGTAILWSLMLPIGMCYFVSVKYGIILSAYYSLLYSVLFLTPLRQNFTMYYSEQFMVRFSLLYTGLSLFTGMAMAQYHRNALLEIDYTDQLNREVARQTAVAEERSRRIEQMSLQTIQTLANAIDAKDPYTRGHSTRVSQYSVLLAEGLGWDAERVSDLRFAALLHDIGKIGIPDAILNKPQRLTDVEYDIIKSHTTMGAEILREKIMIRTAEDVARSHHERYDGKGYPDGLREEAIPEEARIVAIADAFDAMNSTRIYRNACDAGYIRQELLNGRGKQFDPHFAEVFVDQWDRGLLKPVTEEHHQDRDTEMETSSALLQEVMASFVSQNSTRNIDITTGVMNRTSGEAAVANAMRENSGCLVFFDLDNLKKINDISGHAAGDKALKLAGDMLRECGDNSLCCRLGGDEFILWLRDVSREEAESAVRKVISRFEEEKAAVPEIAVSSLSAGAVMTAPADPYPTAFGKADKALYHVKQSGKNGYCFYTADSLLNRSRPLDADKMVSGIRSSGSYNGALDVDSRQFAKLYEYIVNLEKRFDHPFELVLIELNASDENYLTDQLEKAMNYMEQSIRQTIRNVDVMTRYSEQQFLIILVGAEQDSVKTIVDRIFRGYYKMSGSGAFSPAWRLISG